MRASMSPPLSILPHNLLTAAAVHPNGSPSRDLSLSPTVARYPPLLPPKERGTRERTCPLSPRPTKMTQISLEYDFNEQFSHFHFGHVREASGGDRWIRVDQGRIEDSECFSRVHDTGECWLIWFCIAGALRSSHDDNNAFFRPYSGSVSNTGGI